MEPSTTPPATPAAPQVVVPTAEELLERTTDLYGAMWGEKPTKELVESVVKPIPKSETAQAPSTVEAPATTAPEEEPEPEPPAPRELTQEEVIQRTASATAKAVAEAVRPPATTPPPTAAAPAFEMTEFDKADYEIVKWLEQSDPKWEGLANRYLEYLKKAYEYSEKWMAENPDRPFDISDEDHNEWTNENPSAIDGKTLEDARIEMLAEKRFKQKWEPEIEKIQAEKAFTENLPAISANVNKRVVEFVEKTNPELGKLFRATDGSVNLTVETIKALDDADPIASAAINHICKAELEPMILELEKSGIQKMNYRFDFARNPVHQQIDRYRAQLEADYLKLPVEKRMWNGRTFMTLQDMAIARDGIMHGPGTKEERQQKLNELDQRNWTVTIDQVQEVITEAIAQKAKKVIEDLDAPARRKYKTAAPPPPVTSPTPPPPRQEAPRSQPQPPPARPVSNRPPSISSGSDMTATPSTLPLGEKKPSEVATDVMFSR